MGKQRLLKLLRERKLDGILISSVSNIIYLTGYSGFSYFEREAFLMMTKGQNFLITDGRYSEAVSEIPNCKLIEISSENSLDDIFKNLSKKIKIIGIEESDLTLSEFIKLKKYFKTKSLEELKNLRIIKDKNEVSKIEKAAKIGDQAFDLILGKLKPGISEKEVAFDLEYFIRRKGADISFPPIVAIAKNSSIPHHKTSDQRLKTNSIILLDFGAKFENYCSDMTRTIFFGKADDKFKKIYNTVLTAQEKAIELLGTKHLGGNRLSLRSHGSSEVSSHGIKASSIDKAARKHIINQGFPTIPHSLGHGIGIEVHEPPHLSPKSKDVLKPGMVFSIEPGIYIPKYGGVRIEDLIVLEKSSRRAEPSGRRLPHSPRQLIEI